ncbi:kelch-like protein 12 [Hydra vulgaris]|uniref:Kelch-like protein 12 n=1 Tax=Hydra vulgaris TaxID=6087 RepID=A0ABM4BH84_HYDVU
MDSNVKGEFQVDSSHSKKLALCLFEFRKKKFMCDVVLFSPPKEYFAHRNVLCSASPFFLEIFTSNPNSQPTLGSRVDISNISSEVIEDILNFIYLGEICVSEQNVIQLIAASDILRMSNLKEIVCRFYERRLCPSNCLSIASLAEKFNCESLREAADKFIFFHFMDVCKYQEFKTLTFKQVLRILSSDEIAVKCEEDVYFSAMEWFFYDVKERAQYLSELLQSVRLLQTSKYFVSDVIENNEYIVCDNACLDFLNQIKYILNFPERKNIFCNAVKHEPRKASDLTSIIVACSGNQDRISTNEVLCYVPEKDFWYPLVPLLFNRYQSSSVVLNNEVYCIGGQNDNGAINSVERFSFSTDKWFECSKTHQPLFNHAACVFNGEIHIIGGEIDGVTVSQVLRYSNNLGKWIKLADLKVPRKALAVATHKKIYAIGGYGPSNEALASVECYDPYMNEWSKIFSLSSPRAGASAACVGNKIFVFGGEYAMWSYYRSAEVFDINTDEWRNIADLYLPRAYMGIATYNESILLVGGMVSVEGADQYGSGRDDDDDFVDVTESKLVECYNVANNSYKRVCSLPIATAAINCSVICVSKTILQERCGF